MSTRAKALRRLADRIPEIADKLEPVYAVMRWTWGDEKKIPTRTEIAATLVSLLRHVSKNRRCASSSTGGLQVAVDDECASISFVFDVTEYLV